MVILWNRDTHCTRYVGAPGDRCPGNGLSVLATGRVADLS